MINTDDDIYDIMARFRFTMSKEAESYRQVTAKVMAVLDDQTTKYKESVEALIEQMNIEIKGLQPPNDIKLELIKKLIGDCYHIKPSELMSRSRASHITKAKHMAATLIHEITGVSQGDAAAKFGYSKQHGKSVICAFKKLRAKSELLQETCKEIVDKFNRDTMVGLTNNKLNQLKKQVRISK